MGTLVKLFENLALSAKRTAPVFSASVRHRKYVEKPAIGNGKSFRRIVHYPEEYTVEPLPVTNLGGRDPVSGRMVVKGIGGGIKHKYHWVQWKREGPKEEGPPKLEKVLKIIKDGCRTANVALVAVGDELKYILATENMKPGDILKTSMHIPRIPVRPQEGDAYPLGALPVGTQIHNIEKYPGAGGVLIHAAGTYATITRRAPGDRVIIQVPSKRELSLSQECMCTVGRVGNIQHSSIPVGSAQRMRELGNRPRSGWWQRKEGRHGRKIRPPPPVRAFTSGGVKKETPMQLTLPQFM